MEVNKIHRLTENHTKNIFLFFSLLFFFSMLIIPTSHQIERGILLVFLCLCAILSASTGVWKINRTIILLLLLTTSASLLFMLNGLIYNAPGAMRVGTVYVLWPILFVFFAGFFQDPSTVVKFEKTIVYGTIFSALMGISIVMEAAIGQNWGLRSLLSFQGAAVGVYNGYTEFRLFNMTTLIYGFPFLTTLFLLRSKHDRVFPQKTIWIALILNIFCAVISGRRAFWLIVLITPFIISAFFLASSQCRAQTKLLRLLIPALLLVLIVSFTPALNLGRIADQFTSAFSFSEESSAGVRYEQFKVLMAEWMEKPILGQGAGACAEGIIRSEKMSWAYELSYVALLFHTGLLGICIYTAAVLWVFISGISIVRRVPQAAPVILPLIVALAGFLIVNGTNPYLGKFDYLWTIFLPVAAINSYRTGVLSSTSSL